MTTERRAHGRISTQRMPILIALSDPGWPEVYLFGFSVLCLVFAGALWYRKEQRQRQQAEQMRKQIAEDFHDELGSKLTIISMFSELIRREVPGENELALHYLQKISEASNGLYLAMKDLLWTLDPTRDRLGELLLKVRDFGQELFEDSPVDFSVHGLEDRSHYIILPLEYKRHLLLLLKEGIHNAFRHAEATRVSLRAEVDNGWIVIELWDDGKGFDWPGENTGEGLKNMVNRAKKLRGRLDFSSSPAGTKITIRCPMEKSFLL